MGSVITRLSLREPLEKFVLLEENVPARQAGICRRAVKPVQE